MLDPSEIDRLRERLEASGRGGFGYGPNKLTPEQREDMVRMFVAGHRPPAIAKHFGVRRQTVDYHLRRFARG